MFDLIIAHKPALAGARSGRFGCKHSIEPGIRMEAKPEGLLLHILGAPGCGNLSDVLSAASLGDVLFAGPNQWFLASDAPADPAKVSSLSVLLENMAVISDQSHGRVRIRLSGAPVANLLTKGIGQDLDPSVFPQGRSAMTLLGHIAVNVARTGPDKFELIVLRSFAECLWNDLIHMGLEFGIECVCFNDAHAG